jgi:calnexin
MLILLSFLPLSLSDDPPPIPSLPTGGYFQFQSFNDPDWSKKWVPTSLDNYTGKWEVQTTAAPHALPEEKMIFMTTPSSYYALSTTFPSVLDLTDKTLVVQYEARVQESLECGGFYLKLFGDDNFSPSTLSNESRYVLMFGPDRCGYADKVHFIFRHQNPKTGVFEEKHLRDAPASKRGKINHLYTLIVRPDNTFEILIDGDSIRQGSLLTDFSPPVNPPREIDDPTDSKPADWVDDEKIPDPDATKPEEWDETQPEYVKDPTKLDPPEGWLLDEIKFIPDPAAVKPDDWEDEIHGEWEPQTIPNPKCEAVAGCGEYEAPLIRNSLYKGRWRAPMIPNPAYKGAWRARQIPNPEYAEDLHPHNLRPLVGAGFELWTVNSGIGLGNIWIGNDEEAVRQWNKEHFAPKFQWEREEEKKLEPKHRPSDPATPIGWRETISGFRQMFVDAWNRYMEDARMLVIAGAVLTAVTFAFVLCCRMGKGAKADEPGPKRKRPKPVEVTEQTGEQAPPIVEETGETGREETGETGREETGETGREEKQMEEKNVGGEEDDGVRKRTPKAATDED